MSFLHDVYRVQMMAGTVSWLGWSPNHSSSLCVSVVTPCCGEAMQIEVAAALQLNIIGHFQISAAKFWSGLYMCAEWATGGPNRRTRQSEVDSYPKHTGSMLLQFSLLCWNLPLLLRQRKDRIAILFHCTDLEKANVMSHVPAAGIRKTTQIKNCVQNWVFFLKHVNSLCFLAASSY